MKAIVVFPGQPDTVHLAELPRPSASDIPGGRGVVVVLDELPLFITIIYTRTAAIGFEGFWR